MSCCYHFNHEAKSEYTNDFINPIQVLGGPKDLGNFSSWYIHSQQDFPSTFQLIPIKPVPNIYVSRQVIHTAPFTDINNLLERGKQIAIAPIEKTRNLKMGQSMLIITYTAVRTCNRETMIAQNQENRVKIQANCIVTRCLKQCYEDNQ